MSELRRESDPQEQGSEVDVELRLSDSNGNAAVFLPNGEIINLGRRGTDGERISGTSPGGKALEKVLQNNTWKPVPGEASRSGLRESTGMFTGKGQISEKALAELREVEKRLIEGGEKDFKSYEELEAYVLGENQR